MVGPFGKAQRNLQIFCRNMSRTYFLNELCNEMQDLEKIINSEDSKDSDVLLARAMLRELDNQLARVLKVPIPKENRDETGSEAEIQKIFNEKI